MPNDLPSKCNMFPNLEIILCFQKKKKSEVGNRKEAHLDFVIWILLKALEKTRGGQFCYTPSSSNHTTMRISQDQIADPSLVNNSMVKRHDSSRRSRQGVLDAMRSTDQQQETIRLVIDKNCKSWLQYLHNASFPQTDSQLLYVAEKAP